MPTTIQRPATQPRATRRVSPSVVDPATAEPFTLEQELQPFGAWVGEPIWVPPKDESKTMAETMYQESRPFTSKEKRWASVVNKHRNDFTQVREFDLFQASIRLPQGKFFVTVTEQKDFDKITDTIPNCVQTRLEEFLSGPAHEARREGLLPEAALHRNGRRADPHHPRRPLRRNHQDPRGSLSASIARLALYRRPLQAMVAAANLGLALPRGLVKYAVERRQKPIDAYHAHLEFKRQKARLRCRPNLSQVPHRRAARSTRCSS